MYYEKYLFHDTRDTDNLSWTKKTNAITRGLGVNKRGSYIITLDKDSSDLYKKVCFAVRIHHFEWHEPRWFL